MGCCFSSPKSRGKGHSGRAAAANIAASYAAAGPHPHYSNAHAASLQENMGGQRRKFDRDDLRRGVNMADKGLSYVERVPCQPPQFKAGVKVARVGTNVAKRYV